jgi:hypothetical protein
MYTSQTRVGLGKVTNLVNNVADLQSAGSAWYRQQIKPIRLSRASRKVEQEHISQIGFA